MCSHGVTVVSQTGLRVSGGQKWRFWFSKTRPTAFPASHRHIADRLGGVVSLGDKGLVGLLMVGYGQGYLGSYGHGWCTGQYQG
eukprot:1183628-Prorocentrum_minimum.AAC.2